jgi:hypothetical protein
MLANGAARYEHAMLPTHRKQVRINSLTLALQLVLVSFLALAEEHSIIINEIKRACYIGLEKTPLR